MVSEGNTKGWIIGVIMGVIGIIISVAIFQWISEVSGYVYGVVAIGVGIISGGMFGLGYSMGNGKILNKTQASIFLWTATIFGLVGMLAAYFVPVLLFIESPALLLDFVLVFKLNKVIVMSQFNFLDILFILIGALGGKWAGGKLGMHIAHGNIAEQNQKMIAEASVKKPRKAK